MNEKILEAKVDYLISKTNLIVGLTAISISAAVGTKPHKISRDYDKFVEENKKIDEAFKIKLADIYTEDTP